MPYPDEFYYTQVRSGFDYRDSSPGTMDVARFINGRPCWKYNSPGHEQKPKKIILADWTAPNWSEETIKKVQNELSKMIDMGFSCYIWKNGTVIPLSKSMLADLSKMSVRNTITPKYPDEVSQEATMQQHLVHDQVQVLDDYWVRRALLEEGSITERNLLLSDLFSVTTPLDFQNIQLLEKKLKPVIAVLNGSNPALSEIVVDHWSSQHSMLLALLQNQFPNVKITLGYKKVNLNLETLISGDLVLKPEDLSSTLALNLLNGEWRDIKRLLADARQLKKLNLQGCRHLDADLALNPNSFMQLDSIELMESPILLSHLQQIAIAAPHLRKLVLNRCEQLHADAELASDSLRHLGHLNLAASSITPINLKKLLVAAPHIKWLDLRDCHQIKQDFDLSTQPLMQLETLFLNSKALTSIVFQQFLAAAPNLIHLGFDDCNELPENFVLVPESLGRLKGLRLATSSITSSNLIKFLVAAPNLTVLNLRGFKQLQQDLNLKPKSLAQLEHLNLMLSSITSYSLQQLLAAAPGLKVLELNACEQINTELDLAPDSLSLLEILDLRSSSINSSNLRTLLAAAPHLKSLHLQACKQLQQDLNLRPDSLKQLEMLNLSSSSIMPNSLQMLLAAAPHLKLLDLSACKGLNSELDLAPEGLKQLEDLNLTSTAISASNLRKILAATPHLKSLNLSQCAQIAQALDLSAGGLMQLEKLQLSSCSFAAHHLKNLLEATPNLKTLDLSFCDLSSDEFALDGINLASLEVLNLTNSKFTSSNLKKLLKAAPNLKTLHLSTVLGLEVDKEMMQRLKTIHIPNGQVLRVTGDQVPQQEIPHRAELMRNFIPQEDKAPFQYKRENRSKVQEMIIEQLSQYLTLTQQHLAHIPKLQGGICNALSFYFQEHTLNEWEQVVNELQLWDGKATSLTPALVKIFDELYKYVQQYQLSVSGDDHQSNQYLGRALPEFLDSGASSCVLRNPWHAIAIRHKEHTSTWEVYDPNFLDGWRLVRQEELLETIHKSIGSLVTVKSHAQLITPQIGNPELFIEEGGLLALSQSANAQEMLKALTPLGDYPPKSLEGLLVRDLGGIPAWVIGILGSESISSFTQTLLKQFIAKNPGDYLQKLQKSMECLSAQKKHECITRIIQWQQADLGRLKDQLVQAIRYAPPSITQYERRLQTWRSRQAVEETLKAYSSRCLAAGEPKNRLIQLGSEREVRALEWAIKKRKINPDRPIFYINSPEDLVGSTRHVERQADGTGKVRSGPGGPLYDFLSDCHLKGLAPILVVNYDKFNAADLVRFNALVDKERRAAGTTLPEETVVIGLINVNKPNCYKGADFYSRFRTERCPLSQETLTQALPGLPPTKEERDDGFIPINLYHAADWKEQLLGRWVFHGEQLIFEEGKLAKVPKGSAIEIQNGLWDDEDFQSFWREQALNKGFQIKRSDGYDWDKLRTSISSPQPGLVPGALVLNPSRLGEFFKQYACEGTSLFRKPGLIERSKDNILDVNVTRSLSEDEWAMLLSACQEYHVKLVAHAAPGVSFPPNLLDRSLLAPVALQLAWHSGIQTDNQIISSTDQSTTVAQVIAEDALKWTVIDVSECTPADLLRRIDAKVIEGPPTQYLFTETPSALMSALKERKKVLLKGTFSQELVDELAPLLLDRNRGGAPGTLVLVGTNLESFNYTSVQHHHVTKQEKLALLDLSPELSARLEPYIEHESLSRLKTRRDFLLRNPHAKSSDEAWAGLEGLDEIIPDLGRFDVSTSKRECEQFSDQRRQAVLAHLKKQPTVFLAGLSGSGKSTFVRQELCAPSDRLYSGEASILAWAQDRDGDGRKYLFLDEANLSDKAWSEFEGLFNTPPTIFINGVMYSLSEEHRVVFAGNPLSYGDERRLMPFFHEHGNTVVFSPLPLAVVYEKILKPIFTGTLLEDEASAISADILEVYHFLCSRSTTDVLISPRELQMMALLICSHHNTHHTEYPSDYLKIIAQNTIYQLAVSLVPSSHLAEFDMKFKPKHPMPMPSLHSPDTSDYLFTPSRQAVRQAIEERLNLCKLRRNPANQLNEDQLYGGLGSIVLEGSPGVGKSDLVIATLVANGYQEVHNFFAPALCENPFYRMPVSMPFDEKRELLLKAFHEGAVVIIDEINSSPMMERLLNDLLMGKTPDNERPRKPGFMIIGTQNPITMAGRGAPSSALSRRMTTIELPDYSPQEMYSILISKGLPKKEASLLVHAYEQQVEYAGKNHLSPAPTFRDLLNIADEVLVELKSLDPDEPTIDVVVDDAPPAHTPPDELLNLQRLMRERLREGRPPSKAPENGEELDRGTSISI